jgi:saccharopine dehydrogenase-like NADP-dependent oxidoreductase
MAYLDITAHIPFWHQVLAFDEEAKRSGARLLVGAGLVPGIAYVMARAGAVRTSPAERIHTGVLLSMGDEFNPAALDYMLSAASQTLVVMVGGNE